MRSALLAIALLSVACASSGCTPMSTYPPEGKEAAVPWMYPIPQVMAKSLAEAYKKTAVPKDGTLPPLVFNLPPGITYGVWDQVQIDIDIEGARYATEEDIQNGIPVWSVKRITVRGMEAKVDVVYPENGVYQLAVVGLKSPAFGTFKATSFQRFLIAAQKPVANNPYDSHEAPSEIAHTDGDSDGTE